MRRLLGLAAALLLPVSAAAGLFGGSAPSHGKEEDEAFNSACQIFKTGRDKTAATQAFESFVSQFPDSPRSADAQFMIGEAYLQQAIDLLKAEAAAKKASSARLLSGTNPAATRALEQARDAFTRVVGDKKSGLGPSAQYRLGEIAYDQQDWGKAIDEFKGVDKRYPKSYVLGESLLGVVFADLALEQFSQAESNLFTLGETFPSYLKQPEVLYAQGIVSLHKGDYAAAEAALKQVKSAEAQYYLGKTYLLSKRAYLAAAAFENLIRDYPDSDLKEEAQFFIGDSFFLAEDYDGAIAKYQRFITLYPDSPLRVSAMFRIGSSYFQKKDYVEARANFQAVLDRYPKDFFAPIAQYFISESHLIAGQVREALFDYTKVITQYPETAKVSPLAHYKLAWTQVQVGDYAQAVQTCENFLALYPANALAKNVYLIQGNALINLKRYAEATAAFQRVIDIAPSTDVAEQALFTILQNQFNLKGYNSILTSYQYISRHLPPSKSKWRSLSYLYVAEANLALNQVDEAKTIYEMLLKVYPDEPAALYAQDGLAWTYTYKGEDQRALEERQKLKDMLAAVSSTFSFSGLNELGIADSMFNQKNYDDAYQLYDKFVKDNPNASEAPEALYRAGMSLYHLRYYSQAVEAWQKLQDKYPDAPQTQPAAFQAADTLFRAQKYPEAVSAYRNIISTYAASDQLPLAYLRISQAAFNVKDDAAALKGAQALVTRYSKAPEANDAMDLMEAIFDRSRGLDYKATLRALVASDPSSPIAAEAQFRLARRAFESKDYATASAEFQKFSVDYTNNPQLAKAQFYLGESWFNQGDYDHAVPAFERLLNNFDKDDNTALAVFHLASSYYSLKKYDDAVRYYGRLIEEYPNSDYTKAAQFNLALSYKTLGKSDLAQYAYQKYVDLAGGDSSAQSAYWEIFSLQKDRKDFDGALATLQKIQGAAAPGSDAALEAAYRTGELYLAMDRSDDAMKAWEQMRPMRPASNPFRLQALIKLGEGYEKVNDYASAVSVYEDLGHSAAGEVAQSAFQRAAGLRKMMKPAPPEKGSGERRAPITQPTKRAPIKTEEAPAPEPPADEQAPPRNQQKELNLPGVDPSEPVQ